MLSRASWLISPNGSQCGHNGNITWGAQSEPRSRVAAAAQQPGAAGLDRLWQDCRDNMSYCVAYTPAGASPYSVLQLAACIKALPYVLRRT